jgi:hypothetical protein
MAKDLPYFKFYSSEWNDGDITLEDMKTQGVFINICSYYWSQECQVSLQKLQKRFKNCKKQIQNLIISEIIIEENEHIKIKFLDKQHEERGKVKHRNKANGLKGGRPKITQSVNSGLATENPNISQGEEKRKEEKRKEKNKDLEVFEIPDFVDVELWEGYIEARKVNKKTMTERAMKIAINKLSGFERDFPGSANAALEQSILGGWQGVFMPKPEDIKKPQVKSNSSKDLRAIALAGEIRGNE